MYRTGDIREPSKSRPENNTNRKIVSCVFHETYFTPELSINTLLVYLVTLPETETRPLCETLLRSKRGILLLLFDDDLYDVVMFDSPVLLRLFLYFRLFPFWSLSLVVRVLSTFLGVPFVNLLGERAPKEIGSHSNHRHQSMNMMET